MNSYITGQIDCRRLNCSSFNLEYRERKMPIKAVCFDLCGTLAYNENAVSDQAASRFLVDRGYKVYPQAFRAAWSYVSFVDYPNHGYKTWKPQLDQVLKRLGIKVDNQTSKDLAVLYENVRWKTFPDAENAISTAKTVGLKTAIVTTISQFKYEKALKPFRDKIDLLVDGYTFHCEKSNPKIYLKTLETLEVKASETVMIGDDVELDILLPKTLGMHTILLDRTGKFSDAKGKEASFVVKNLNEAAEKLKFLVNP